MKKKKILEQILKSIRKNLKIVKLKNLPNYLIDGVI